MGVKDSERLGLTVGISAIVVGILLIVSGALGTTMYNTMDCVKGDTADELKQNKGSADGINVSFILWIILGIVFLAVYSGFIAYESGISVTRTSLCQHVPESVATKLCSGVVKTAKDYAVATAVIVYIIDVLLIVTCSEGIALHTLIGTYKGGNCAGKEVDADQVTNNKRLSDGIYNTYIAFLVIAVVFFIIYTAYLGDAHKHGLAAFKQFQASRSGTLSSSSELEGGGVRAFSLY